MEGNTWKKKENISSPREVDDCLFVIDDNDISDGMFVMTVKLFRINESENSETQFILIHKSNSFLSPIHSTFKRDKETNKLIYNIWNAHSKSWILYIEYKLDKICDTEEELLDMKKRIDTLERKLDMIWYAPNMPGAIDSKNSFEELSDKLYTA